MDTRFKFILTVYIRRDATSLHVLEADEAISLGSISQSTEGNPFLDVALLVQTALQAKAQAIHPGYGYLSENPAFADAVREAGLIFIGPSSNAMSTLGNKRSSKVYLSQHASDVPLIPGFSGSSQSVEELESAAKKIGFPVMLKASSGGGGKGMRIVHAADQLKDELERAQSEAKRSFGDADIILEKFVEEGKHVEIQIVGDRHGGVVSFLERDCSVQRRHQKIIEETPCPWLSPSMRARMSATAKKVAMLIGYEGAGTVEFVVDVKAEKYYFLEVNARLQVEHPITEEVTGWDLVSLQLFVAAGGKISSIPALQNIQQKGHAIECRLCAEDPQNDFFPEHGTVSLWLPAPGTKGRDTRYETAIHTGSRVSIYFDSMIAKIVVWAPSRTLAIERMVQMLANTVCAGVRTNQLFLQSCLLHAGFRSPAYTTSFIPVNLEQLLKNPYGERVAWMQSLASIIPALYLRHMRQAFPPQQSYFRNVRKGFRNQRFDPINQQFNVIETVSEGKKASPTPSESNQRKQNQQHQVTLVKWLPQQTLDSSNHHITQNEYQAQVTNLPVYNSPQDNQTKESSIAKEVTARYNALSSHIRRSEEHLESTPHRSLVVDGICRVSSSTETPESSPSSAPAAHRLTVSIDGKKINSYIVPVSTDSHQPSVSAAYSANQAQTVIAHIPSLGTWSSYRVSSLLSYAESGREEASSGANESALKVAKAPMPCKVLKVLKQNGDVVKKGENVMVVESMKMEMSISMAVEGKFETKMKEGDAVEEGVVLCEVL